MHRKLAPVAKLVDALDLGSSVSRRVGSSPIRRTKYPNCLFKWLGYFLFLLLSLGLWAKGGCLLYVIADAECVKAWIRGVRVWSVLRQKREG